MGDSRRRKGKELVEDSYFVPMRSEATNEATASCSSPIPDEQEEQRREEESRQLAPKRRRDEPLKPPPGFHFRPTDHELAFKYLYRKKMYNLVPYDCIREANVYAKHPRELIQDFMKWGADGIWYFFTPRERKYPLGDRPARHTTDLAGHWKATGTDKKMYDGRIPHVTAMRKTLIFDEGRSPDAARSNWTMHEYTIEDPEDKRKRALLLEIAKKNREPPTDMKLDDCVLCTIQRARGASEDAAGNAPRRRGRRRRRMNPGNANADQQQQIVLPENNASDQQIVLSGYAELDVNDASAGNQQIVPTGEEHIESQLEEDQFVGHIDSACQEEQFLPSWDPLESFHNVEGDLHSIFRPALPAPEKELELPDDWYDHVRSLSMSSDSFPQGDNSQDDPEGKQTRP